MARIVTVNMYLSAPPRLKITGIRRAAQMMAIIIHFKIFMSIYIVIPLFRLFDLDLLPAACIFTDDKRLFAQRAATANSIIIDSFGTVFKINV